MLIWGPLDHRRTELSDKHSPPTLAANDYIQNYENKQKKTFKNKHLGLKFSTFGSFFFSRKICVIVFDWEANIFLLFFFF